MGDRYSTLRILDPDTKRFLKNHDPAYVEGATK